MLSNAALTYGLNKPYVHGILPLVDLREENVVEECGIKGCDKPVTALGLCVNHWRMMRKHGSPLAKRPLSAENRGLSNEERFWKSVRKSEGNECWEWQAVRDRDGYGRFKATIYGVTTTKAHRFSHMLATGEILSDRQVVMHSCDNPSCVNPAHLSSGTVAENTRDMIAKGRHVPSLIARAAKIAKLNDDQVRDILRDPRRYADIAADYGIHKQHVVEIKSRSSRFFVKIDPSEIVRNKRGSRGADRSKNLTDDDVREIRKGIDRNSALAKRYGVTPATICDIQKRRSWRHVE